MSKSFRLCSLDFVLAILFLGACQQQPSSATQAAPITHGMEDTGHPSATSIQTEFADGQFGVCTGNLVGSNTVVTAAHCLQGVAYIAVIEGQLYEVEQAIVHANFDPNDSTPPLTDDLGLLILKESPPVQAIPVSRRAPSAGQTILLVGFGKTSPSAADDRVKRKAQNNVEQVSSTRFTFSGTGNGEGSACFGDSGGPVLAEVTGGEIQLGVISAAQGACGTLTYNVRLDAYTTWLTNMSGGDVQFEDIEAPQLIISVVGSEPYLDGPRSITVEASDASSITALRLSIDGSLVGEVDQALRTFDVHLSPGTHQLRAEAVDAWGNQGNSQIDVTITAEIPDAGVPNLARGVVTLKGGCNVYHWHPISPLLLAGLWLLRRRGQ